MQRIWQRMRELLRPSHRPRPAPEPDWAAIGLVEVRVSGSGRRYAARFADETFAYPVPGLMTADERRVANAMLLLGMPPAMVSTLGEDEPGGTTHIVEIPASALE